MDDKTADTGFGADGPAPLAGLTVVDMGQVLATPFASYLLALLGADVIKVEPIGGEWLRSVGGGLGFATQNSDKRSIALDMRAPGATELVLRLTERADVFVEGFAPGTADAMGLGWSAVSARNNHIVYGSLSAFGETGPFGGRPGFDHVVQAVSGIMGVTGFPGQPPTKVGAPFLDYGGGLLLAFGILAGLLERQRTGEAVHIDVAMLDVGLLLNANAVVRAANTGDNPPRTGNDAFSGAAASGAFETADGLLMLAANKPAHFVRLMELLNLDDWAAKDYLALPGSPPAEVAEARRAMHDRFVTQPALHWEDILNAAGIPAAAVRSMTDITTSGHAEHRGLLRAVPDPGAPRGADSTLLPGAGIQINGVMPGPSEAARPPGADTATVLAGAGFTPDEIEALTAAGTIA